MHTCYNQACAKDNSTLEQDLLLCNKAGFDYIEIRLDMLAEYLKSHTVEDLQDFFSRHRIFPEALNAIYLYDEFLSDKDDPERAQALLEKFMYALYIAKAIEAPSLVIVPSLNGSSGQEAEDNHVRILKTLVGLARPTGVKLAFEIVGLEWSSVRTAAAAKKILERVDEELAGEGGADCLGYVADCYNMYLATGDDNHSDLLQLPGDRIFIAHLNDFADEEAKTQQQRVFPGFGKIRPEEFVKKLAETGYDGAVSVETFNPYYYTQDATWVIRESYEALSQFVE